MVEKENITHKLKEGGLLTTCRTKPVHNNVSGTDVEAPT